MKAFDYVIKDEIGIHARPAGLLVKEAKKFESTITLKANGKSAAATKLMAIMSMGVKSGQTVTVEAEGADEEAASAGMQAFFEENL
ncbi:MAG: HPr family phosphocarrier protein [Lachnospiraceae bacterium]|nr:HPr family phosphocarrier protein [Lachnospiraceae bacterium]